MDFADPGVAAVEMGHPQLLSWLQSCCSALLRPGSILKASAQHCDLAGLQLAWQTLAEEPTRCRDSGSLHQVLLDAAAESTAPDAVAKTVWALAVGAGACRVSGSTAVSAALSGDPDRLRWLLEHGYQPPVDRRGVKAVVPDRAMEHGSLGAVQWMVDEAGFRLPGRGTDAKAWGCLMQAAAKSADGVAKLRWLQEQGAPPLGSSEQLLSSVVLGAVQSGQVDVLRHLLSVCGPAAVLQVGGQWLGHQAARSGSITAAALLRQAGFEFDHLAYDRAAAAGSMGMLRWLATEAGVQNNERALELVVSAWPNKTPRDSGCLLQALKQLVECGCRSSNPSRLLTYAAERGDLALVRYLQETRPWQQHAQQEAQVFWRWQGGGAVFFATTVGCEAVLELLAESGSDLSCQGGTSPWLLAGKHGDRGTLTALRRLGAPWECPDLLVRAVYHGCCMPAVRWLAGEGAPVGSRGAVEMVVRQRTFADAMWLLELAGPAEPDAGNEVIDLT